MFVQRIAIAPSVRLAVALCVLHLVAAAAPWLVPGPAAVKALVTLLVSASLVYFLARDATLHAAHAIVALEISDTDATAYRTRSGARVECEVLASSYVSARLTIVHLRPHRGGGTRKLVLVCDNVDPREFRRLRMWLRWKRGGADAGRAA